MDGITVWLAASVLYAVDSSRPLARPTVFVRLSFEGVTAEMVEPTIRVGGRGFRIPNPLRPDITYFPTQATSDASKLSEVDQQTIAALATLIRPVALASVVCGVILLAFIPMLSTRIALSWSILVGLASSYAAIFIGWYSLWKHRMQLHFSNVELYKELIYCLLCPPNAINMARRITDRHFLSYSAEATLRTYAPVELVRYLEHLESVRDI